MQEYAIMYYESRAREISRNLGASVALVLMIVFRASGGAKMAVY